MDKYGSFAHSFPQWYVDKVIHIVHKSGDNFRDFYAILELKRGNVLVGGLPLISSLSFIIKEKYMLTRLRRYMREDTVAQQLLDQLDIAYEEAQDMEYDLSIFANIDTQSWAERHAKILVSLVIGLSKLGWLNISVLNLLIDEYGIQTLKDSLEETASTDDDFLGDLDDHPF